jgi:uncharacterized protein (DUF302 family)
MMKTQSSHESLDFTERSAYIRGEATMAVVSIGTFDDVDAKLAAAIGSCGLEVVHVHEVDRLLRQRAVGPDFRCRVYEVWSPALASELIEFDADLAHTLACRNTLHDQGGVTTVVTPLPRVLMTEFSHATQVGRISRRLEEKLQQLMRALC